jgi:hypothetical protein
MKSTVEQAERLEVWLGARVSAIFSRSPFPRLPRLIEEDLKNDVDFSDLFAEYGFTADGAQLLPHFHELHLKRGKTIKA